MEEIRRSDERDEEGGGRIIIMSWFNFGKVESIIVIFYIVDKYEFKIDYLCNKMTLRMLTNF